MNYGAIREMDISNGKGIGVSLFVSGCRKHCYNCHNPELWDFNYGNTFTSDTKNKIVELCKQPYITRFSILGGEPLENQNIYELACLTQKIKTECPNIKIWLYTGYTMEEVLDRLNSNYKVQYFSSLINNIDILVDGPFIQEQKDISLAFRGSSNQRIINMREMLTRKVV